MADPAEGGEEETDAARRLAADVLAFTALPARWVGAAPARVARDLADALFHAEPGLRFAGVRLVGPPPSPPEEAVRARGPAPAAWERRAGPSLDDAGPEVAFVHVGSLGARGIIVVAADDRASLGKARLLAVVGANQADVALRSHSLESEVARALDRLAALEKLSALGQLVGGVAHELRTPLTYAGNYLVILENAIRRESGPDVSARMRPHLAEIEEALHRINAIVAHLRRFARQDSSPALEEDLRDAVKEALHLYRATHAGGARIEEALRPTPPIHADRIQMQQVVLNLVENAAHAVGAAGTVRVSTGEQEGEASLVVEDNGVGMTPEVQARLFQAFHTTKPTGLGLGLSIVRRILESHRGRITVRSAPGRGTRVEVRLPAARPAETAPTRARPV